MCVFFRQGFILESCVPLALRPVSLKSQSLGALRLTTVEGLVDKVGQEPGEGRELGAGCISQSKTEHGEVADAGGGI